MPARSSSRLAPLTGVLFFVLALVGFMVGGDEAAIDKPAAEIRDAYDDEGRHMLATFLVALAGVALIFFGTHLRRALRAVEGTARLAYGAFAGAITAGVGFLVAALIHGALTEAVEEGVADPGLQALNALDNWSWLPFAAGMGVMVLSSGLVLARAAGPLPSWLGWAAVVIGVAAFLPFVGFVAFLAGGVWVLVTSILLYTKWDELHAGPAAGGDLPPATRTPA